MRLIRWAYSANSLLSVALARSFGQAFYGKSKERQALADRALPFTARILPLSLAGDAEMVEALFAPLGYTVALTPIDAAAHVYDLSVSGERRLADLLNQLYVLLPVLDNAKHYFVDNEEIDKLLAKGEGWLAEHPARQLITRRTLKHRPALAYQALARLDEGLASEDDEDEATDAAKPEAAAESALEKQIRLHELRLDAVAEALKARGVSSVLDLGCDAGKFLARLVKEAIRQGFEPLM